MPSSFARERRCGIDVREVRGHWDFRTSFDALEGGANRRGTSGAVEIPQDCLISSGLLYRCYHNITHRIISRVLYTGHSDAGEPKDVNDVVAPAEFHSRSGDMDDGEVPQVSSSSFYDTSSTADDLPAMGEVEASAGAASGGGGECGAGAGGSGPHFVDDSKLGMLVEPSSVQQNGDGGNEVNNAEPAVSKAEIMTEAGSVALLGLAAEGAQMPSEDVPMPVQAHTAP